MSQKYDLPKICGFVPSYHELKANKRYLWCSCGLSKTAPFCDGSQAGTSFKPVMVKGQCDGQEALFCECKHTKTPPFCDGTHANLEGGYQQDDPESPVNAKIQQVGNVDDALTKLDNGCVVVRPNRLDKKQEGTIRWCPLVTHLEGAEHQTQFYAEVGQGQSPQLLAKDVEMVIFVFEGSGSIALAGKSYNLLPSSGVYVGANESFSFDNPDEAPLKLYITRCPGGEATSLVFLDDREKGSIKTADDQDEKASEKRVAVLDENVRNAMGDRFWQILVDESYGADMITQFVGHIPPSKAMPHRHLYEETLIFKSGQGMVWTLNQKTPVGPGDVLFLPRKQWHSVQSFGPDGMMVVGVIYPGNNPGINY